MRYPTVAETEPFWAGVEDEQLRITQCQRCTHWQWPPRSYCLHCKSTDMRWVRVEGRGTVFSWITVHHPMTEATRAETPFHLALIELDDTPVRVLGPLRADQPHMGMASVVGFEQFGDLPKAPVWREADPAGSGSDGRLPLTP
jgi:uncharacterized OB-fold protein